MHFLKVMLFKYCNFSLVTSTICSKAKLLVMWLPSCYSIFVNLCSNFMLQLQIWIEMKYMITLEFTSKNMLLMHLADAFKCIQGIYIYIYIRLLGGRTHNLGVATISQLRNIHLVVFNK